MILYFVVTFCAIVQASLLQQPSNRMLGLSSTCRGDYSKYLDDLNRRNIWALKMFDANGRFPAGFLEGDLTDLGSFDECLDASRKYENAHSGKYCVGIFAGKKIPGDTENGISKEILDIARRQHKNVWPRLAVCVPNSCSTNETEQIYRDYGATFTQTLCQSGDNLFVWNAVTIFAAVTFVFVLLLVLAATFYDLYFDCANERCSFVLQLSVLKSYRRIVESADELDCLAGLRVISILWIVLFQVYRTIVQFPLTNEFYLESWQRSPLGIAALSGGIAVDTFFYLSGLLVSYNFLKMSAWRGELCFGLIRHYVCRYLRIVPAYAVVILFYTTLLRGIGSGPFWPLLVLRNLVEGCQTNWWRGLLFIQNCFFDSNKCVSQSWYLDVDLQLFAVSPIFLYLLKICPVSSIVLALACALGSTVYTSFTAALWHADFTSLVRFEETTAVRAAAWFVGFIAGFVIFETRRRRTETRMYSLAGMLSWTCTAATFVGCVWAEYRISAAINKHAYYGSVLGILISLRHLCWPLALSRVVWACIDKHAGFIDIVLSCRIFRVLSRLVYGVFLTHRLIVSLIIAQTRRSIVFDNFYLVSTFLIVFIISSFFSFLLGILVEIPFRNVSKYVFGFDDKNRQPVQVGMEDYKEESTPILKRTKIVIKYLRQT